MENDGPVYRALRDWAADDRPREKLLEHGPEILSDAELIAIVLGSGIPGENVVDMARRLLAEQGGIGGLIRADVKTLRRTRGLGPAKAAQLAAAVELGRRAGQLDPDSRPVLDSPEAVWQLLGPRVIGKTREEVYILAVDTRIRLIGAVRTLTGGVNAVGVRASDVYREAMLLEAYAIVLAHNHPSGDPAPSPQDVALTKDLIDAGDVLGIRLLDHVVLGQAGFVSMQREGMAGFRAPGRRHRGRVDD
jgi:DNA repair protein RadC